MKFFNNLKLATKLVVSFAVLLAITAGMGIFSLTRMSGVNTRVTEITTSWLPGVDAIGAMRSFAMLHRTKVLRHIMVSTDEEMAQYSKDMVGCYADYEKQQDKYEASITLDEDRKLFQELTKAYSDYRESMNQIVALSAKNDKEAATKALTDSQPAFDAFLAKLTDTVLFNRSGAEKESAAVTEEYTSARSLIIGVILGAIVIGMAIAFFVARLIGTPVRRMVQVADQLALGDVEQNIDINTRDEVGTLAESFRKIIASQTELSRAAGKIAAGDMSTEVKVRSDKDVLSKSFVQLQTAVRGVITETDSVAQAAKEGQLSKRGNAAQFQGAYRQLVQGFNETLDAVIEPVKEASSVLEQVAARDLTARVHGDYKGEHALIKNALNTAVENLEEALSQAAVGSEQVTSAATQIAQGSQSLAQGASEQASSLEEISSSLEEMASMTRQNAENSNQGKLLAAEATGAAQRGNEAMGRMAEAIDKIKASSDATAKIIKTIDEIAFQTNLLALNAAVEAARAGEAGKGFAVVAEEVRNLAQRSAEAAKNTANMIEESVKNAEGGVRITEEVAKLLVEIGEGNRKVNDLVAEIAAASGEQSKGIEQVNLAVTQLDKVTQQNAANSEESASAAEELNSQAASLSQTVGQFKISSHGQVSVTPVATASKKPVVKPLKNGHSKKLVGAGSNGNGHAKSSRFLGLDEEDFQGF